MPLRPVYAFALVAVVTGCDASGVERGGEALVVDPCAETDGGHAWRDLYTCYFGPTGKASCAGATQCHGDPQQAGAITPPGYFVCGSTRDECWFGMTHPSCPTGAAQGTCQAIVSGTDATKTALWGRLRGTDGPGVHNMPGSTAGGFAFSSDDQARISAWIREGAQDN